MTDEAPTGLSRLSAMTGDVVFVKSHSGSIQHTGLALITSPSTAVWVHDAVYEAARLSPPPPRGIAIDLTDPRVAVAAVTISVTETLKEATIPFGHDAPGKF